MGEGTSFLVGGRNLFVVRDVSNALKSLSKAIYFIVYGILEAFFLRKMGIT